jgi:hypothetical protein
MAKLKIEATLESLNFATVVLRRDLGFLQRSPQVFVTMSEILDHFIAFFGAQAVFHSEPFPLNLMRQPIRLHIQCQVSFVSIARHHISGIEIAVDWRFYTFPLTSIFRFFMRPAVTLSMR